MKINELKKYVRKNYNQDKNWCIKYHNCGDIEMYNIIFGRMQSMVGLDNNFNLGLNLLDDMEKNIPWNKKMLAGYSKHIANFDSLDIDNLNEK